MLRTFFLPAALAAGALALSACGGGGKAALQSGVQAPSGHAYSSSAGTRYSYTPYATRSRVFTYGRSVRQSHIGGDLEPRENLRHFSNVDDINYYMGTVRDGAGVSRIQRYETDLLADGGRFAPFTTQPTLYMDAALRNSQNRDIRTAVWNSVLILNDALPPEFQIRWGGYRNGDRTSPGEIMVSLDSPASINSVCDSRAVACARYFRAGRFTSSAIIHVPNDLDTEQFTLARTVIVHELLHALGIQGHVDSVEFPESIMGTSGQYFPNLGHIISRIDREALQIIYMRQRSDLYNDWGEWSDTSFHIVGRTEDEKLHFGVALFNGLPQPWVRGAAPRTALADNHRLGGTATWNGALLGFSGPSPIAGSAELQVRLSSLGNPNSEQDLRFRDIYFVNRQESSGADRWFYNRNIAYKVRVSGNVFNNVRAAEYEQGIVTGAFMGGQHEHMGGTVKRTDMVGAFGGSR